MTDLEKLQEMTYDEEIGCKVCFDNETTEPDAGVEIKFLGLGAECLLLGKIYL